MAKNKVQYVKDENGKRVFAVIPYDDYLQLVKVPVRKNHRREVLIIAKSKNCNMIRAWRSYLKLTQVQMADRMMIAPVTYCRLERSVALTEANLRAIAQAMGIPPNQLK